MTARALVLYSAVMIVPSGNDDGGEIVAGEIDGVSRDDVTAWAADVMAGRTSGRVFVCSWEPGPFGERIDTGVTGERLPDDSAVRWFGV